MYTPLKDKYRPPASPNRYSAVRYAVVPRYAKSYLWLTLLVFIFGLMLLSDNEVPVLDFLPNFPRFGYPRATTTDLPGPVHEIGNIILPSSTPQQIPTQQAAATAYKSKLDKTSTTSKSVVYGKGDNAFTPDDIVILFKTGATSLWRRVPMHLSTSFANKTMTPNVVFYSDNSDTIAGHPVIDVLANVSASLKQSRDFELYRSLPSLRSQNLYLESASMEGDHYLPGGWRLDKYKFLPMMAHAAAYHPGKKWYIYMEDDNYYFWHSLYTWLGSNFSPSDPFFLGSPAAKLGEDFAHGGSGFMISGAALTQTFGSHPNLASSYESYAAKHCCGDQVLSHAMASKGVPRLRKYENTSFIGLQALPTWRMAFGKWNWCSPLFNVHKVHQADISRLYEFESAFHARKGYQSNDVMDWSYLFKTFVARDIFDRNLSGHFLLHEIPDKMVLIEEWDNLAAEKWFSSVISVDGKLSEHEREQKPWFSAEGCSRACWEWEQCLSWKFQDDNCGISSTVSVGMRVNEGVRMVSGFVGERIRALVEQQDCGRSKYIPG